MYDARELLKNIPYPLALLTTRRGDEINAMPVSWLTQVSSEPPMVQAAVKTVRYTHDMLRQSGRFAVVFLRKDQKDKIQGFKSKDPNRAKKFEGFKTSETPGGCPVLTEGIGWLDCEVVSMITPGDHTLFVGEITDAKLLNRAEPLTSMDYEGYYYGLK